jgi:hypothetical protein
MRRVWGAGFTGRVGEGQGNAPANVASGRDRHAKQRPQVMAVTNVARDGDQNSPPSTHHCHIIMSAAPAHTSSGPESAPRPRIMPRQVSGQSHGTLARRPEPRPPRGDDFLQRLREAGL